MHNSALNNCKHFFDTYSSSFQNQNKVQVVDIGSQDVNGSLKSVTPSEFIYKGLDFVAGKGVDMVLEDPYMIPLEDNSTDIVLSSSCFEHSEMFWLVFLEIMRILKPNGLFYLNVPSNGPFHRYPVDCWRFYPDSAKALETWGKKNGYKCCMLESYISNQDHEQIWNDFVGVFLKDENYKDIYKKRILNNNKNVMNGKINDVGDIINFKTLSEDVEKSKRIALTKNQLFSIISQFSNQSIDNKHELLRFFDELNLK